MSEMAILAPFVSEAMDLKLDREGGGVCVLKFCAHGGSTSNRNTKRPENKPKHATVAECAIARHADKSAPESPEIDLRTTVGNFIAR